MPYILRTEQIQRTETGAVKDAGGAIMGAVGFGLLAFFAALLVGGTVDVFFDVGFTLQHAEGFGVGVMVALLGWAWWGGR